ncbi:cell death abnormality protein 1-like [Ruditapes philippinarum]|uniref:cell death abnormality protein 1-like n=1 Tax=Ruditapes philippinarum TaxID=129788 RepID=UPI00295AEF6E|nr:cell death abnormality protein 1-like [Ruditapes philippinarum]
MSYKCPDSCLHPTDNETGTCDHISRDCLHGCKEGFAGPNCSITCPDNCLSNERGMDICNETTEQCLFGCKDGFYGSNCTGKCSDVDTLCEKCSASDGDIVIECKKCIRNFYLSAGKCRACNYWCVYSYIRNEQRCRHEDGYCNHGCRPGRYGFMCNNRCRATCKDECHRETGMCFDCGESSYCGPTCQLVCQDGCLRQQCNQSCECVNGCTATHWGEKCQTVCNSNCIKPADPLERVCNSLNGTCLSGCDGERFWKNQCSEPCSNNCVNGTCEHYTGNCKYGCTSDRVYGGRCDTLCNKNCDAGTCKREDGYCDKGCKEGSYGNNRENNCSATCLNNKCERADGSCTDGCITGYEGHNCDIETKSVDKFLLGFAISGWALFVTLLAFVITTAVRRRLAKSKRNEQNSVEDTQAQTINQQVYTTLQHEQDENNDKTKYEVLRLGRGTNYQDKYLKINTRS